MWLPLIIIIAALLILALSKKISSYRKSRIEKAPEAKKEEKKETTKKKASRVWTIVTLLIFALAGYGGYKYFTGLPSRQQAPAVAQQQWQLPICAGGEYDFSTAEIPGEIAVGFQTECISQVTLPPRVVFRTDPSADVKIKFIDGSEYIDGPKKQVWYGLKKGVFKVRGLSEAGTMKITLEKSS